MKPKSIFRIENDSAKTVDKEECEEQLLAEYATLLGSYLASVAVLTGFAGERNCLPRKFSSLNFGVLHV
jgi:hypothetical protein